MSKETGHNVKRVLRYNIIVAVFICVFALWNVVQTASVNPVLAQSLWLNVIVALWNLLVAAALSKLAFDVYETK